jgi:hypothetical protein
MSLAWIAAAQIGRLRVNKPTQPGPMPCVPEICAFTDVLHFQ